MFGQTAAFGAHVLTDTTAQPIALAPSLSRKRERGRGVTALLIAPAILVFLVFFIVPLGVVALFSFLSGNPVSNPNARFTTRHYERLFGDIYYAEVLWTTLRLGLWTTAATL